MDDGALCHIIVIIIIIIMLSRWSRNTLSTQSIPSCTTHSVKLNTGARPNTGYSCQHHARVEHTSAELHYIQRTQLRDDTSDVTWKWCNRVPTMSVEVMLTAVTAFNSQLQLLVAPQSCLTSRLLPAQIWRPVKLTTKYTHKSSCSNRSCLHVCDEGTRGSGCLVLWRCSSSLP